MTIYWLLVIIGLLNLAYSQCCLQFSGWRCVQCPEGTRQFKGHCLFNIPNCSQYIDGFQCGACDEGYDLIKGECEEIVIVEESSEQILDLNNLKGESKEAFLISDEILRSLHSEVKTSKVIGAKFVKVVDGKDQVFIEYDKNGKYYQGNIEVDLSTFIFKELSFKQISEPTIVNEKREPQIMEEKPISKQMYAEQIKKLENQGKEKNKELLQPIAGKVVEYDDGSKDIVLVLNSESGKNYLVTGKLEVEKTIILSSIEETNDTGNQEQYASLKEEITYIPTDINALKDNSNYLIVKDFISRQLDYKGIDPQKVGTFETSDKNYYQFFYRKNDKSEWIVRASINKNSPLVTIESEEKIKQGEKQKAEPQIVDLQNIFKDVNFILVREAISKELEMKYQKASIKQVKKLKDEIYIKYIVNFLFADTNQWQTVAILSKNDSSVIVESDTEIFVPQKIVSNKTETNSTERMQNDTEDKNTSTFEDKMNNTDNQIEEKQKEQVNKTMKNESQSNITQEEKKNQTIVPQQNENQTIPQGKNQTNVKEEIKNETQISESKNQTNISEESSLKEQKNQTMAEKDVEKEKNQTEKEVQRNQSKNQTKNMEEKNQTIEKQEEKQIKNQKNVTQTKNQTKPQKNQTEQMKNNTIQEGKNQTTPHRQQKNQTEKNETDPPKQEEKEQENKQQQEKEKEETQEQEEKPMEFDFDNSPLPPAVLVKAVGFTRLKKAQVDNDPGIQRILFLLSGANQKDLQGSQMIAVFLKQQGFIQSYKIYYSQEENIYEGQVAYDLLRRRSYIISFGVIRP